MRGKHLAKLHELREHKRAFTVLHNLIDELFQPCDLARAMLPMIKQPRAVVLVVRWVVANLLQLHDAAEDDALSPEAARTIPLRALKLVLDILHGLLIQESLLRRERNHLHLLILLGQVRRNSWIRLESAQNKRCCNRLQLQ